MKKVLFGLVLGLVIGVSSSVLADSLIGKTIQGTYDVFVNGKKLNEKAIVVDGTSYLPVRKVGEVTGFEVKFDRKEGVLLKKKDGSSGNINNTEKTSNKYQGLSIKEIDKLYSEYVAELAKYEMIVAGEEGGIQGKISSINESIENIKKVDFIDENTKNQQIKKYQSELEEYLKEHEPILEEAKKKVSEITAELELIEKVKKSFETA